jgi:hypothetical protein
MNFAFFISVFPCWRDLIAAAHIYSNAAPAGFRRKKEKSFRLARQCTFIVFAQPGGAKRRTPLYYPPNQAHYLSNMNARVVL